MGKEQVIKIYKKYSDEEISEKEIIPLLKIFNLIISRVPLDEVDMVEIIDTLRFFESINLLKKINNETLELLSKILGNNSGKYFPEDSLYFFRYLRNLLIPFNLNHCDKEYNLDQFLGEFDIFLNLAVENLDENDLIMLKKYNLELWEIIIRCKSIVGKYTDNSRFENLSVSSNIILDNTLTHSATMLYFCLDEFDYKYDLLSQLFEHLVENFAGFLIECSEYGIYQNGMETVFNPENILNEYIICKKMLEQEYNPPIKIKRKG